MWWCRGVLACGLLWWWWPGRAAWIGGAIWLVAVLAGVVNEGRDFMGKTLPGLLSCPGFVLSAAQEEIQGGGDGRELQAARAYPTAQGIATVLGAKGASGWLPPELVRPAEELWALNNAMGTRFTGNSEAGWVSPFFTLRAAAVLVLTQCEARLSIEPMQGGAAIPLRRLVGASAMWERWGRGRSRGAIGCG